MSLLPPVNCELAARYRDRSIYGEHRGVIVQSF